MTKNILDFAGFEYGLAESPILFTGGLGGSGSIDSSCAIVSGQYGRYGRQLQHNSSGGGYSSNVSAIGAGGSNVAHLVFRTYFAISALPVGQNRILGGFASNTINSLQAFGIRVRPNGFVEAGYISSGVVPSVAQGTLSDVQTSTIQTCPLKWHRLDAHVDVSGSNWILDWQLNGLDQPQVISSGHAATTWSGIFVGTMNQSDASTSGIMYSDDYAIANISSEYPLGPGKTILIVPNSNGTLDNPTKFREEDGTVIDTDSWQRIAEGSASGANLPMPVDATPTNAAGDARAVEEFGPFSTANALRFLFEDVTLDSGVEITCVTGMFSCYTGSNSPSVFGQISLNDGVTVVATRDFVADQPNKTVNHRQNNSSAPSANDIGARIPSPSGHNYWTQSEINAVRVKFTVRSSDGAAVSTDFYGLAWYGLELHLSATDEFTTIGCLNPDVDIQAGFRVFEEGDLSPTPHGPNVSTGSITIDLAGIKRRGSGVAVDPLGVPGSDFVDLSKIRFRGNDT